MEILKFELTPFLTNCYVLKDGGEALVIDPGEDDSELRESLEGSRVVMICNTHGHLDHCGGNGALMELTGAPLACHEADLPLLRSISEQAGMFGVSCPPSPEPTQFLNEGDTITVGSVTLEVLLAPGHSPGHVVLYGPGVVFAGDVLFAGSIGRTDLPGGNHGQLLSSIREKLMTLPGDTIVYSGHGPRTTIGAERKTNPFLV